MIGKVTRGTDVGGLLRYLFGPGRANEHVDPHLVATWCGDDPVVLSGLEPAVVNGKPAVGPLADRLSLPTQLDPDGVDRPVWQCSMRTAPGDRRLTDAEWAEVARDVVDRTGFAPSGDPGGCRWVAVRHADDHVHIAVVLARQDGDAVAVFRDWPKVHAAARAAEARLGLAVVPTPIRTATAVPSRAEAEKARRRGEAAPARTWLARQTRLAAAGARGLDDFGGRLEQAGVLVSWRFSTQDPLQRTGYSVGRPGDVDPDGRQIWFGGSRLAPDLSLPRLLRRWPEEGAQAPTVEPASREHSDRSGGHDDSRRAVLDRAERAARTLLDDDGDTEAHAIPTADLALVLAHALDRTSERPVVAAAEALGEEIRSRAPRVAHDLVAGHPLHVAASEVAALGRLTRGELRSGLVLLAHLVRLGALALDNSRSPARLAAAASPRMPGWRTPGAAPRDPDARTSPELDRAELAVRTTLPPPIADAVLRDPAWSLLVTDLEVAGPRASAVLGRAVTRRELDSARSPAAVLHHRLLVEDRAAAVSPACEVVRGRPDTAGLSAPVLPQSTREEGRPQRR